MKWLKYKSLLASLLVAAAVTGGVITFGMESRTENSFEPFDTGRKLQNKQVLFPDGEAGGSQGGEKQDAESFWEKDESESVDTKLGSGSGYLLDRQEAQVFGQFAKTAAEEREEPEEDVPPEENRTPGGDVYEITDDSANSDLILPGGNSNAPGRPGRPPGAANGDTATDGGSDSSSDNQGSGSLPNNSTDNTGKPDKGNSDGNSNSSNSGTNRGDSNTNDNTNGGSQGGDEAPDPGDDSGDNGNDNLGNDDEKPGPGSDLVQDPIPGNGKDSKDEVSTDPVPPASDDGAGKDFGQADREELKNHHYDVVFRQPDDVNTSGAEGLYRGQTEVDELTAFQSLEAYIQDYDDAGIYYWTNQDLAAGSSESGCVKVTGVSFDDSKVIHSLPIEKIPDRAKTITIYISWRLDPKDEWTEYRETKQYPQSRVTSRGVTYDLMNSRVLVLNQIVQTKGETIRRENILNADCQYADAESEESAINLLEYQGALLGSDNTGRMSGLFPGWKEDGVLVPFLYSLDTTGRHVLEPSALLPLDTEKYQVNLRSHWLDREYAVTTGGDYSAGTEIYLQALTDYTGEDKELASQTGRTYDRVDTLEVPQYVQSVEFDYCMGVSIGSLKIPESVLYVNTNGIPTVFDSWILYDRGLEVEDEYFVEEGNPRYTSKDGLLYNLDQTEILGVPTGREQLTVGRNITSVILPYQNHLAYLEFDIESLDELPAINYGRLNRTCTIVVPDALLNDYIAKEGRMLQQTGVSVAAKSDVSASCTLRDGFLLTAEDRVHDVMRSRSFWLSLPDYVTGLEAGALDRFAGESQEIPLSVLVLPQSGDVVSFGSGCFDSYKKMTIACYSKEQETEARTLQEQYPACSFTITRVTVREDGYSYFAWEDGVMLCAVPYGISEFAGEIPPDREGGEPIPVTVVGEYAFEDCGTLRWVILPEDTVKGIAYGAFRSCWNLEGVLIGTQGTFIISEKAFEGCYALQFVGSNAEHMILDEPDLALDYGYSMQACALFARDESCSASWKIPAGVDRYTVQECGGTYVLYGSDAEEIPRIALRSGVIYDCDQPLPATTTGIYDGAFPNGGVRLILSGDAVPELIGFEEGRGFFFGVDDSRLRVNCQGSYQPEDVIRTWVLPMTGYSDMDALRAAIAEECGADAGDTEIYEALTARLLAGENRVRMLLDMEPAAEPSVKEEQESEAAEETTQEEPEAAPEGMPPEEISESTAEETEHDS